VDDLIAAFVLVVMIGAVVLGAAIQRGMFGPGGFFRERYMHNMETNRLLKLSKEDTRKAENLATIQAWQQTQIQTLQSMSNYQIEFLRLQGLLTTAQLTFLRDVLGLALDAKEKEQIRKHDASEAALNRIQEEKILRLQAELIAPQEKSYEDLARELEETQRLLEKAMGGKLDSRAKNQNMSLLLERLRKRK